MRGRAETSRGLALVDVVTMSHGETGVMTKAGVTLGIPASRPRVSQPWS